MTKTIFSGVLFIYLIYILIICATAISVADSISTAISSPTTIIQYHHCSGEPLGIVPIPPQDTETNI